MILRPQGADLQLFKRPAKRDGTKAYLVGGGIASKAAVAFMIRDGDMLGSHITTLEESGVIGESLDGAGNSADGYVLRGGRLLDAA